MTDADGLCMLRRRFYPLRRTMAWRVYGVLAIGLVTACSSTEDRVVAEACSTYQDMVDAPAYADPTDAQLKEQYYRDFALLANRSGDDEFAAAAALVRATDGMLMQGLSARPGTPEFAALMDELGRREQQYMEANQLIHERCASVGIGLRPAPG